MAQQSSDGGGFGNANPVRFIDRKSDKRYQKQEPKEDKK